MKKILFSLLLLCAAVPAQAMTHPEQGQFGFYAEWLYMGHSIDDPYFAIDSSPGAGIIGPRYANRQNWKSGYRLEGIWAFCDRPNDIRVRWTHFPSFNDNRSVSGPRMYGTLNHPIFGVNAEPGTFSINDRYNVWNLDVLFGQKAIYCGPFALDLQGGLQYSRVKWRESVAYLPLESTFEANSKIWGVGPEMGMDFSYALFNCFEFTGRASAGILISKREADWSTVTGLIDVNNSKYWGVMPTTNLRFGLAYHHPLNCGGWGNWFACLGNLDLDIEIGYEVITYYKSVDRIRFVDSEGQGASFDELMDLTLHGPYLHLGVAF